ncbi:2-amino-4-hydroxy-6-hydroxymethyldihydropteridine diphosphokinase [Tepidimonas ignava]|uniref:2-amino-4-hydroxy-6-hydroxymethyldihydropteridine pyrophosphokinase n=1 Tax=Tepidimonas ignava TaxID=114249 RepID=A0A4R3LEP1_9BURK|nr:2-amino-4-hydroxy-6-hydroxymethyldihydropteridine diphosphokinase [Tepidimonas ignava]TCS98641.1 2-amino-4-hydroxy-6-hydroxymethyldihydropteridine diphosphokinase [Tepidimonas ignava]TSE20646.1 2-amino-4-hydroxy-6-hydroxymethyldihydropteridine pyrophosphokinase [Tepidimonas ignava]
MRDAVMAYVGLGANLGDAAARLRTALGWLDELPQTRCVAASGLWRSAPVDADGPDYCNAVAALRTHLTAPALLQALLALEARAGRQRPYRNAPRTLDLDLLLYGGARIASPWLTVPHPRLAQRAFVLVPLREVAPHLVDAAALDAVAGQAIRPWD